MTKAERYEKAMYRFFRHIQDQIEDVPGWMDVDFYNPQIDAYEFNRFINTLAMSNNATCWHRLHEKYSDYDEQDHENT